MDDADRSAGPPSAAPEWAARAGSEGGIIQRLTHEELRLLHELTSIIASARSADDALRAAIARICAQLDWSYGEVWLRTPDDRLVRGPAWAAGPELDALTPPPGLRLARGEAIPGRAWAAGAALWTVADADDAFLRARAARELGLPHALAVPVLDRGEVVAILLFFLADRAEAAGRAELVVAAAAWLGMAIVQKRTEDHLRDRETKLQLLIEHVRDGVLVLAPDGRIAQWTAAAERVFGWTAADMVGVPASAVGDDTDLERVLALGSVDATGWRPRRDGTRFWAQAVTSPIRAADGAVTGFVQVVRDQTALKEAADRLAERTLELERSNRELDGFARVASHDLQEPIRKIRTFASRLEGGAAGPLTPEGTRLVGKISVSAARAKQMVDDLLEYARLARKPQRERIELAAPLAEALVELEERIAEAGACVGTEGELPVVLGNPVQIRRVFQNLLSNAIKYSREGVPPRIVIRSEAAGAPGFHRITVTDNGIGFEGQYGERIFGLLQRLHGRGQYEGTGMGLAISRRIVESHGGSIRAEGTPGHGASFILILPTGRETEGSDS